MAQHNAGFLCNDGLGPLRVPGFADLDVHHALPFEERFSTPFDWQANPYITARELAVLRTINAITDEPDWHAVLLQGDAARLTAWQSTARLKSALVDDNTWTWILRELHDKAEDFLATGRLLVFDTGATGDTRFREAIWEYVAGFSVSKFDSPVTTALAAELQQGTAPLFYPPQEIQSGLRYQVDPSMFPLAFNRTPVLTGAGEFVTLEGQVCGAGGRGHIAPAVRLGPEARLNACLLDDHDHSTVFQWLPCEVKFQEKGEVAITSYINNLDAVRFRGLYRTIEKVIAPAIESWNQVLVKAGRGRTPLRIVTFGVEYSPRRLFRNLHWVLCEDDFRNDDERAAAVDYVEKYLALPGQPQPIIDGVSDNWREALRTNYSSTYKSIMHNQWLRTRTCEEKHPRMGHALSYDAWKAGSSGACVIPPVGCPDVMASSIPDYNFQPLSVCLQRTFRDKGLQVVVKLASIELTPESPRYDGGHLTIEGVQNEHIVAVSMLWYSIENVDDARIEFWHHSSGSDDYDYDKTDLADLAEVLGMNVEDISLPHQGDHPELIFSDGQNLGSVAAKQGRLMSYPNQLKSRVDAFELQEKTQPGHIRYLVLCLVDPHYRICSTRNVAPQQMDQWFDQALSVVEPPGKTFLPEIYKQIYDYVDGWPMSVSEALELSRQEREVLGLNQRHLWPLDTWG